MTLNKKCRLCKSINNLLEHHPDYSKPNRTVTLCCKCHSKLHVVLRKYNINPDSSSYYIPREHLSSSKSTKQLLMFNCIRKLKDKKPHLEGAFITADMILKEISLFYTKRKWITINLNL